MGESRAPLPFGFFFSLLFLCVKYLNFYCITPLWLLHVLQLLVSVYSSVSVYSFGMTESFGIPMKSPGDTCGLQLQVHILGTANVRKNGQTRSPSTNFLN